MSTPASPFPILPPDGHRGGNQPSPSHNHHPYAIKTTSTALLTRSNTTSQNSQNPHYYIPSSPSPSSKHRFSKSETSIDIANATFSSGPRPLPVPPNLTDQREPTTPESLPRFWRTRAETLPATSPSQISTPKTPSAELDNLPSNPRAWTTSQLASYLVTALRVRSGETHPLPHQVTSDIAAFVKEARLTGRTFLRLSESDLEQMGVNNLWRTALLDAARNLRQNVLKGRIWGFNDETPQTPPKKSPFSNSHYNSSSSSIDEEDEPTPSPPKGSRVRGMVATLERSASQSDGDEQGDLFNPSPTKYHYNSKRNRNLASGSEGDDEATFSRASHHRRPDLNDSPSSSGSERPLPLTPDGDPFLVDDGPIKRTSSPFPQIPESELTVKELLLRSPHDIDMEYEYSKQERAKRLAKIDVETTRADGVHRGRLIGAEAWEQIDLISGATVKHVPASPEKDVSGGEVNTQRPLPLPPMTSKSVNLSPRRGYPTPLKDAEVQTDDEPETDSIAHSEPCNDDVGVQTITEIVLGPEVIDTSETQELKDRVRSTSAEEEAQLQVHIQSTRALLEAFRLRLELVEKNVEDMLRKEEEREFAASKDALARNDVDLPSIPTDTTLVSHCEIASQTTGDHEVQFKKEVSYDDETNLVTQSNLDPDSKAADLGVPGRTNSSWLELARAGDGGVYGSTASAQGDAWDPLEGGLSTYVFMVGVGVCVVVLQTVVRRWATRKT